MFESYGFCSALWYKLKFQDLGTSFRLFFRPARLSRDALKNEPPEHPKPAIFAAKAPPPDMLLRFIAGDSMYLRGVEH